jgi:hypothetical protein
MYKPRFFLLEELAYPGLFEAFPDAGERLWICFDPRALLTLDRMRERYGPIIVNNWKSGGDFSLSGLRPMDSRVGAALSQHKFGRAFDCKFRRADPAEVRGDILSRPWSEAFEHITRIEDFQGMGWVHFDVANHDKKRWGIKVVRP